MSIHYSSLISWTIAIIESPSFLHLSQCRRLESKTVDDKRRVFFDESFEVFFSVQGVISPSPSIGNATCHVIALLMNTHPVGYSHTRPHVVTTKSLLSQHWLPLKLKKCYVFGLKKIDELNAVIKCQVFENKIRTRTVHSRRVMETRRWGDTLQGTIVLFKILVIALLSLHHFYLYYCQSHTLGHFRGVFSLFQTSDCQSISVQFLARARHFSHFKSIQSGCLAHLDSYNGGWIFFKGGRTAGWWSWILYTM